MRSPAVLAFALLFAPVSIGQQKPHPSITRSVKPETGRDLPLEKAITAAMGDTGHESIGYFYNRVDLNGDGKPEVLVYVSGQTVCGSGGCTVLVFNTLNNGYKLVSQVVLARTPVIVSQHATHGWNDLILPVGGGGMKAGYAVLHFDGTKYPENPTVAPADNLSKSERGVAYFSGSDGQKSGIVIAPAAH